jgi:hypothetical protein
MSVLTNLDEIVDYPDKIALALSQDKTVVGFLTDNPNVDFVNDEIDVLGTQIFNYNFIPDTQTDSLSYITIDTVITASKYDTTKSLNIIVTVISNKTNMKLNPSIFLGVAGNRRDNLVRYTDLVIRNMKSNTLGIGKLQFTTKTTPVSPVSIGSTNYVAKQLIYEVPNFDGRVKA